MIHIYVDSGSSTGGTGSSAGTISSSRAYQHLLEAINALGTLSDATTIHCGGTTADTQDIGQTPFDFVTSSNNYLLIQGNNRLPRYNSSAYRLEITNPGGPGGILYNNTPGHVRYDALQVKVTTINSTADPVCYKLANANVTSTGADFRMSNCIAWGVQSSGVITGFESRPLNAAGAGQSLIWNCLAIRCRNGFTNDFVGAKFWNNTAAACDFGLVDSVGNTLIAKNNVVTANGNSSCLGYVGPFLTDSDFNYDDSGSTPPGRNSAQATFSFTSTSDFSLTTSDTGATGRAQYDVSSGLFSDDMNGVTRLAPWDAGCSENTVSTQSGIQVWNLTSTGRTVATAASTWSIVPPSTSMIPGGNVILGFGCASTAVTISTVTDNTTNVYLKAVAHGTPRSTDGAEIWYCQGYSTASTRISMTLSGLSSGVIALMHATGISTGTPVDVTGSSGIAVVSTNHSANKITPSSNFALLVSFAHMAASTIGTINIVSPGMTTWLSTTSTGAPRTFGMYVINGNNKSTASGAFRTSSGTNHASVIVAFNDTNAIGGGGGGTLFWVPLMTMTGIQDAHV